MNFFGWLAHNWEAVCKWGAIFVTLFKGLRIISNIGFGIRDFFKDLSVSRDTLHLVATNHLPHLQESLDGLNKSTDKVNDNLANLRTDIVALSRTIELFLVKGE